MWVNVGESGFHSTGEPLSPIFTYFHPNQFWTKLEESIFQVTQRSATFCQSGPAQPPKKLSRVPQPSPHLTPQTQRLTCSLQELLAKNAFCPATTAVIPLSARSSPKHRRSHMKTAPAHAPSASPTTVWVGLATFAWQLAICLMRLPLFCSLHLQCSPTLLFARLAL